MVYLAGGVPANVWSQAPFGLSALLAVLAAGYLLSLSYRGLVGLYHRDASSAGVATAVRTRRARAMRAGPGEEGGCSRVVPAHGHGQNSVCTITGLATRPRRIAAVAATEPVPLERV